jgi:hypothetical protein
MLALSHVDPDPRADQRVFLNGLSWADERQLPIRRVEGEATSQTQSGASVK